MSPLEIGVQFHLPTYAHVSLPHLMELAAQAEAKSNRRTVPSLLFLPWVSSARGRGIPAPCPLGMISTAPGGGYPRFELRRMKTTKTNPFAIIIMRLSSGVAIGWFGERNGPSSCPADGTAPSSVLAFEVRAFAGGWGYRHVIPPAVFRGTSNTGSRPPRPVSMPTATR